MNEEKFTELVNLYLDGEISGADFELLKAELLSNPKRQEIFIERCRLDRAMRMALSGGHPDPAKAPAPRHFWPPWAVGLTAAASVILILGITATIFRQSAELATVKGELAYLRENTASPFDLQNSQSSLVAHMRLLGLRPELAPQDKQFQSVPVESLDASLVVDEAELLVELQKIRAIPEPQFFYAEPELPLALIFEAQDLQSDQATF